MNPEQQRIAIAEACGLKCVSDGITHCLTPCVLGTGKYDPEGKGLTYVPDYLNDLNAMHEAVGVLTRVQTRVYGDVLNSITKSFYRDYYDGWEGEGPTYDFTFCEAVAHISQATAAQRAEAFLKTIGKWEGAQP